MHNINLTLKRAHVKKYFVFLTTFVITELLIGCSSSPSEEIAKVHLMRSQKWLAINGQQEGVQQTASGLQYRVLKQNTGSSSCKPTKKSTVTVNYDMRTAITNRLVDQNDPRDGPSKLPLPQVIKGWKEGVALMQVDEVWEFYIPPHLAYGEKSSGPLIKSNTALTSRIELLSARPCYR